MSGTIPVLIEDQVFPIVRVVANPNFKPPKSTLLESGVDSQMSIRELPGEKRRYAAEMRVKVLPPAIENNTDLPYFVDVVGVTFITLTDHVAEADSEHAAAEFGHMVLYPAIRELIISITARQPWGKFSIGFSTLGDDSEMPEDAPEKKPTRRRQRKPSNE